MPNYKLAHIQAQGVDLIIIPLDAAFGAMTPSEQKEKIDELQTLADDAGLRGTVVPMWKEYGRTVFIAPREWHSVVSGLTPDFVERNLNRQMYV